MKHFFTLFFLTIFAVFLLIPKAAISGETNPDDIKKNLPKMLGANNVGKDFWFTIPPCYADGSAGYENFIKIFVTSPVKTLVTLEIPVNGKTELKYSKANDVIEFNVTPSEGQPYPKGEHDPEVAEKVWPGAGIHVFADYPIVVYCVVRYHWTSDGFLAIPVSSFGKEYIVSGYPADPMFKAVWNDYFPDMSGIVAAYPDTKVKFTLGYTQTAGGLKGGGTAQALMQKGDVWMFSGKGDMADLSGSKVVANKPVGVVTGNMCNNIPVGNQWCDYTVEMDLPTFTWGKNYHVPKVPGREFASLLRIYAKESNTQIFRDGKAVGFIRDPGGAPGNGWLEMRIVGKDVKPRSAVFSGDKPIGVTLLNCGVQEDQAVGGDPNSDPFVMVITPIEQYQKDITFCTPGLAGHQPFPENYVNLVYETGPSNTIPDDLEFGQVSAGQVLWDKISSRFGASDEQFAYDVNGKHYAVKTITLPGDGVYKIRGGKPFAAYSFGYSDYDSYGFPTSAALADLERPDTLPPVPVFSQNCADDITDATVTDKPDDPDVRSNLSMIVFWPDKSFNYEFDYDDFIPGQAVKTKWSLHIIDPTQDAKAVITFSDRRGNDTTITIEYTATKLKITPAYVDYNTLNPGGKKTVEFTLTNLSQTSSALVDKIKLKRNSEGFTLNLRAGDVLPKLLAAGQSMKFDVTFTATAGGEFRDSIGVGDTCVFAYQSEVRAFVGEPIIEVSDWNYGLVSIGKAPAPNHDFTVKNSGDADLIISGWSQPAFGNTIYQITNPPAKNLPDTLKPGVIKQFTVQFTPQQTIDYPDSIVFQCNAKTKDNVALLNGKGTRAQITATSYAWDRYRITRPPDFPTGPYPTLNGEVITLRNDGNEDLRVQTINILSDSVNAQAFEFNRTALIGGFNVPKNGGTYTFEVKFHPAEVGYHHLKFTYDNTADPNVFTELTGYGTLPEVTVTDVGFGRMLVHDNANIKTGTMTITNDTLNNKDKEWADNLKIDTLIIQGAGTEISTDITKFGSEGFRFDMSKVKFPIILSPGSSYNVPGEFVAEKINDNSGYIYIKSDGKQQDRVSHWYGKGFDQGISLQAQNARICVGDSIDIPIKISNIGSGTVKILNLTMNPDMPSFLRCVTAPPLDIDSATSKTVTIRFASDPTKGKLDPLQIKLVVNSSIKENPYDTINFTVEAVHYDIKSSVKIIDPKDVYDLQNDVAKFAIALDIQGQDISMAQVDSIHFDIAYNSNFLTLVNQPDFLSSFDQDFTLNKFENIQHVRDQQGKFIDTLGVMSFDLIAKPGQFLNRSGDILAFQFKTYLPTTEPGKRDMSKIVANVLASGVASCVNSTGSENSINMGTTCGYNLRKIAGTGFDYKLQKVSPNPVGESGTDINFSVGLEGKTEIEVYNNAGQLIAKPVDKSLQPGEYSVHFPVTGMTSGTYICKMKSGPFESIQEMVISK